jgi:hypothetical protein
MSLRSATEIRTTKKPIETSNTGEPKGITVLDSRVLSRLAGGDNPGMGPYGPHYGGTGNQPICLGRLPARLACKLLWK